MSNEKGTPQKTLLTTFFVYAAQFTAPAAAAPVEADRPWLIRLFAARQGLSELAGQTPLPCFSSCVLQNGNIHQGHPPPSAMICWGLKTDRGNSASLREERCAPFLTPPSPVSISPLLLAFVTAPLLAGSSSGLGWDGTAWGRKQGGWYSFCWLLGGQDCPANMRQTFVKTMLAVQVRSVVLL